MAKERRTGTPRGVRGGHTAGFELGEQALRDLREHGFDVRPFAVPGLDISSSALRRRVYAGRTIRYLVPEAVREIIEEESLYRRETDGGRVA